VTIPVGYALASFVHTSAEGTEPFVCTLGVDIGEAGGDFINAANSAFNAWALWQMTNMDADLTLTKVTLAIGDDGPSGSVESSASPVNGTRVAEGLPWSLSAIMNKQTAGLGRRSRGRCFIPGLISPSEIGQGGAISSGRRTTLTEDFNSFYDELVTPSGSGFVPLPPVLFHSTAPSLPTPITSFGLAPLCGWIRKRIR
jgi:hypothetical protein